MNISFEEVPPEERQDGASDQAPHAQRCHDLALSAEDFRLEGNGLLEDYSPANGSKNLTRSTPIHPDLPDQSEGSIRLAISYSHRFSILKTCGCKK